MPTRALRLALFASCASLALVPALPPYLPLVDLPQHVALHAIWNHIQDPAWNLNGRFVVSLATPYALPHLLAHAAGQVLGPEGGLRFVLALALVAFPLSALFLLRAFGRPAEIALAAVPAALSLVYWFGFISYVMALPLVLVGIGLARRCATSSSGRDAVLLAIVALLTVATHGFAFMLLLPLAAVAALATTRLIARLGVVAGSLAPAAIWAALWGLSSSAEPAAEPLQTTWGDLREHFRFGLASLYGSTSRDARVLVITVATIFVMTAAIAAWGRSRRDAGDVRGRWALAAVALAASAAALLCPQVFMNTWGLWERIPPIALIALAGAIPWPDLPRSRTRLGAALTAVALFASGSALLQSFAFSAEARGIRELALRVPPGSRILYTACGEERPWPTAVPAYKHVGAYVQAARGGDLSYSFAHFSHMVVRYRGGRLPGVFDPAVYDVALLHLGPRCPPLEDLRRMGPLAVEGDYVAFRSAQVTPELAAVLEPEQVNRARTAHSSR